jgi:hypothetical protein
MGIRLNVRWIFVIFCNVFTHIAQGQTPAQIIAELERLNTKVVNWPCVANKGMLISNKAMNIFLTEKVASYLSDENDLSLYKNYVRVNAADGSIAINHNFHEPIDSDDWVRSFVVIGARASKGNIYTGRFSGRYVDNQLGLALQKTWMGKPATSFTGCDGSQKKVMDSKRALILQQLETAINQEATDFEQQLSRLREADIPGQNVSAAQLTLRHDFYAGLRAVYLQKFFEAQSAALINSTGYKLITDHWTTAGIYIPIIPQRFEVSPTNTTNFTDRYNYPVAISISHTRFWTGPKLGRLFFTLSAGCSLNNTVQTGLLPIAGNNGLYSGDYRNFLNPSVSGKLAYLPLDSHVGLSLRLEKNFGTYHALNGIVGIPIVLIDKKGVPAINFECQLRLADLNHTQQGFFVLPGNRTSVGLTVGIPFSKIVY